MDKAANVRTHNNALNLTARRSRALPWHQSTAPPTVARKTRARLGPQVMRGVTLQGDPMADDRSELMSMIAAVLSGDWTVAEFEERFLAYYHSDVPLDLSFNDREENFFSAIAERFNL